METVIRREEQSCFSLQVRVHSCTYSIKCLWLQICGRTCKMVTLLLLVAFGQSIGQVGIVSNNAGHFLEETMLSFVLHTPVLHQWSKSAYRKLDHVHFFSCYYLNVALTKPHLAIHAGMCTI